MASKSRVPQPDDFMDPEFTDALGRLLCIWTRRETPAGAEAWKAVALTLAAMANYADLPRRRRRTFGAEVKAKGSGADLEAWWRSQIDDSKNGGAR